MSVEMTQAPRGTRLRLALWASLTALFAVLVGLLVESRSDGWKIIVSGHDYLIDLGAWTLLGVGISGLLLTAGRAAASSSAGHPGITLVPVLVALLWSVGVLAGFLALVITNSSGYYRLDTPTSSRQWLVQRGPTLGDASYSLYASDDGFRYRFVEPMPPSSAEWDPFARGDYEIIKEDGVLLLRYPRGPEAATSAEVVFDH